MAREARASAALRLLALAGLALVPVTACRSVESSPVPTVTVEAGRFEYRIGASGELEAERATPVQVPGTLEGVQRISWIEDEGARVEEGQPLARLDEERVVRQLRDVQHAIETIDVQILARRRELEREKRSISKQLALLETERANAEKYAPRDPELFTRIEILEAELDMDLIDTRMEHARTRLARYEKRARAELEIMRLQRRTQSARRDQLEAARRQLELRAPHAGLFLRGRTWQGERMRPGMTVWRGQALGRLPDLSVMRARVQVLESEAAGLAQGLRAEVTLDAHPERTIGGRVERVEPIANPIDPESPVKYFETLIALEETDIAIMRPGSRVRATVFVDERDEALSIPNQAIFNDEDGTFVHARSAAGFERRPVSIGARSVARSVVERGLSTGDVVALVEPPAAGL